MTADEQEALSRVKTDRAKEHLQNLYRAIIAFRDTKPYPIATKRDPQTRQLLYYVANVQAVPPNISAIAGDVLQNLRSALDHLAYALFMVGPGGASGGTGKHVYFPISDDATKYRTESIGKVKGMRQDAIDAINAVKPYKGGNDTLWILHKLNNIDKHRFVLMAGAAFHSLDLGAHGFAALVKEFGEQFPHLAEAETPHMFFKAGDVDRKFPLKAGDELFIDGPDAEVNEKMQFRFEVALREPGIIEGKSLIETLQGISDLVDNLVTDFKLLL